jgi:hypothetical protein
MGVIGILLPGGVADAVHAVFDSSVQANIDVDGGRSGAVPAWAGDDEGASFGEAVAVEVELLTADNGGRPVAVSVFRFGMPLPRSVMWRG